MENILRAQEILTKDFIDQMSSLVHPNVLKMVNRGDGEGFNMVLNQIHYGSLKMRRELEDLRNEPLRLEDKRIKQAEERNKWVR